MRKLFILIAAVALSASTLSGQRLMVGDKAPEIKGKWMAGTPDLSGKTVMVEFYHSTNASSAARLSELDKLARDSRNKMVVVVVTREHTPNVAAQLTSGGPAYYPLLDSGTTFPAYKVQYVPFSVIYDRKGRILWLGNPSSMSKEEIMQFAK